MSSTASTTTTAPCAVAIKRFGPGRRFRVAEYERHLQTCTECARHQRQLSREQRTRTKYSRDFPLTGDVHKYLLIVPQSTWKAFAARVKRDGVSVRSVLNTLVADYGARQ